MIRNDESTIRIHVNVMKNILNGEWRELCLKKRDFEFRHQTLPFQESHRLRIVNFTLQKVIKAFGEQNNKGGSKRRR